MIERYYNNAIEQVWGDIGKSGHNYMLLRYSNDFSVQKLESVNCLKGQLIPFFISLQRKKTTGCAGMLPNSFSFKFIKSKPRAMLCLVRQPT